MNFDDYKRDVEGDFFDFVKEMNYVNTTAERMFDALKQDIEDESEDNYFKDETLSDKNFDDFAYWYCNDFAVDKFSEIFDEALNEDSVTGNASGSYTFNEAQARENIEDLVYDENFKWHMQEFCTDFHQKVVEEPETIDVLARYFTLEQIKDDLEEDFKDLVIDEFLKMVNEQRKQNKVRMFELV